MKDFLRVFFFLPPLWFLRLLAGWPDEDGGFGVLAEVDPGLAGSWCSLSMSMGASNWRRQARARLANQARRVPGGFQLGDSFDSGPEHVGCDLGSGLLLTLVSNKWEEVPTAAVIGATSVGGWVRVRGRRRDGARRVSGSCNRQCA